MPARRGGVSRPAATSASPPPRPAPASELGAITPVIDGATPSVRSAVNHPCPPVHPHVDRRSGCSAASSRRRRRRAPAPAALPSGGTASSRSSATASGDERHLRACRGGSQAAEQQARTRGRGRGAAPDRQSGARCMSALRRALHTDSSCLVEAAVFELTRLSGLGARPGGPRPLDSAWSVSPGTPAREVTPQPEVRDRGGRGRFEHGDPTSNRANRLFEIGGRELVLAAYSASGQSAGSGHGAEQPRCPSR